MGGSVNEESRLQLERYLQLVNRRKFVFAIPVILAVAAAALLSYVTTPVYTATATARIDFTAVSPNTQDTGAAQRFIDTYAHIIQTTKFTEKVILDLNLDTNKTTPSSLARRIGTAALPGTELVTVTAKAGSGEEAAAIANKLVDLLQDQTFMRQFATDPTSELNRQVEAARESLNDALAELSGLQSRGASAVQIATQQSLVDAKQSTVQTLVTQLEQQVVKQGQEARAISVIEVAGVPDVPTSPRWKFNLAAGLLAGLAAGVALSLVMEYIDPTLRGVRDLEGVTRLPVLASIPFGIRWKYPPPPVSPDYRLLATKLQTAIQEQHRKSVLFTSARTEEGNTTVATYSAMAMAQAGLREFERAGGLSTMEPPQGIPADAAQALGALGGQMTPDVQKMMTDAMQNPGAILQELTKYGNLAAPPPETMALLDAAGQARLAKSWTTMSAPMRKSLVETLPSVPPEERTNFMDQMESYTQDMNATINQSMKLIEQAQKQMAQPAPNR